MKELIEEREELAALKDKLLNRMANKQGKAFEQLLKKVSSINEDIRKINSIVKDGRSWRF